MNKKNLLVDRIAGCHARLGKIRKLGQQMAVPDAAGNRPANWLAQQRLAAIAVLQRNCPHSLLMEVPHDAWRGPYRPVRLCEICGLVESAWQFDRLATGRTRPGSWADCRRAYRDLLGDPLPDALEDDS
jgi:hypothetical protein